MDSESTSTSSYACSKCHVQGHNSRSCGVSRPRRIRVRPRKTTPRSKTTATKHMRRTDALAVTVQYASEMARLTEERPKTRADCVGGQRPCPFAGCRHHLALDINPDTGSIKLNYPHLEIWEMSETCSLDVADRGEGTLEAVGALVNIVRERIRQVEVTALLKLRRSTEEL